MNLLMHKPIFYLHLSVMASRKGQSQSAIPAAVLADQERKKKVRKMTSGTINISLKMSPNLNCDFTGSSLNPMQRRNPL